MLGAVVRGSLPTLCLLHPVDARYTAAVNAVGGVLTVDLQLLRNGSMNAQQVAALRAAWT